MSALFRLSLSVTLSVLLLDSIAVAQQETPKSEAAPPAALGPAETLAGTIAMVEAEKKILIVRSAAGIPYNFIITPTTRITAQKQRLKFSDLASRQDQRVTVRFVPTRRGNIARSVEIAP